MGKKQDLSHEAVGQPSSDINRLSNLGPRFPSP